MKLKIQFLGAAGTVTGSRDLLSDGNTHVLLDCGLFQGVKNLRERNWSPLPFPADRSDAAVLSHAAVEHRGALRRLPRAACAGPVDCSAGTRALAEILLPDSGHLQEEDARRANRHHYTKHNPAEPLYSEEEALQSLALLQPQPFRTGFAIGNLRVRFTPAGHILGAACVHIETDNRTLTFSGDLGRPNELIMLPPEPVQRADYLILESTYGDRLHPASDPKSRLTEIINQTAAQGGVVMIPAFAVGRAQDILLLLTQLRTEGKIPAIPIYLDSPMAIDVTDLFNRFVGEHRLSRAQCAAVFKSVIYTREQEESKRISADSLPKIIVAGAGMLTGGRILHHLRAFGGDPRNTIIIAGYQAPGTRGAALLAGTETLRIFGEDVRIRCHVELIEELSAHADYAEITEWLKNFEQSPRTV